MARNAQDREDLLRDASGMPFRVELRIDRTTGAQTVFCGFRDGGAFSLYWGQDNVFQFNRQRELRRAFWKGQMVACFKRQVHWLSRIPDAGRLKMLRTPFSNAESVEFRREVTNRLATVRESLNSEQAEVVGQFPVNEEVMQRVAQWLASQPDDVLLAAHPGVGKS